jgi:hypothetical protein
LTSLRPDDKKSEPSATFFEENLLERSLTIVSTILLIGRRNFHVYHPLTEELLASERSPRLRGPDVLFMLPPNERSRGEDGPAVLELIDNSDGTGLAKRENSSATGAARGELQPLRGVFGSLLPGRPDAGERGVAGEAVGCANGKAEVDVTG